jgi:hypothetical protein
MLLLVVVAVEMLLRVVAVLVVFVLVQVFL